MTEHDTDQPKGFIERGLHWPVMLVCMFLVSASFVIFTAVVGAGSGSKMIEPDYYERAVDWDSERELLEAADRLGWRVTVSMSPTLDPKGSRLVSVLILDAQGNPIEDAVVEIVAFATSQAHDRFQSAVEHNGAGQYQHRFQGMHETGFWETRVSISALDEQALVVKSLELED